MARKRWFSASWWAADWWNAAWFAWGGAPYYVVAGQAFQTGAVAGQAYCTGAVAGQKAVC